MPALGQDVLTHFPPLRIVVAVQLGIPVASAAWLLVEGTGRFALTQDLLGPGPGLVRLRDELTKVPGNRR